MTISEIVELILTCVAFFATGLAREYEGAVYSVNSSGQWTNDEIEKLVSRIGNHVEIPRRTKASVCIEYVLFVGTILFGLLGIISSYELNPMFMIGSFSVFAVLQMRDDLQQGFDLIRLVLPYIIWATTIGMIIRGG